MKHYSLKPVHVSLHPSRLMTGMLGGAALSACGLVAMLPVPLWIRLTLVTMVLLATLYRIARDALLRIPRSVVALEVTAKGEFRCMRRDGDWLDAIVLGDSFVTPWLTVLNLRFPGRHFAGRAVVLPDMVDADAFQRLRVCLKWGSQDLPDSV